MKHFLFVNLIRVFLPFELSDQFFNFMLITCLTAIRRQLIFHKVLESFVLLTLFVTSHRMDLSDHVRWHFLLFVCGHLVTTFAVYAHFLYDVVIGILDFGAKLLWLWENGLAFFEILFELPVLPLIIEEAL